MNNASLCRSFRRSQEWRTRRSSGSGSTELTRRKLEASLRFSSRFLSHELELFKSSLKFHWFTSSAAIISFPSWVKRHRFCDCDQRAFAVGNLEFSLSVVEQMIRCVVSVSGDPFFRVFVWIHVWKLIWWKCIFLAGCMIMIETALWALMVSGCC